MKINQFSPARWALAFLLPTLPIICAAALYTWLVDPLWQWSHPHHLVRWHRDFNERIQKTNYLASREVNIDTLILGSSRSTYFRPEWLGSENGFNYATNSCKPHEFAAYIDYAKKQSAIPLKLIMVEAACFGMVALENTFEKPSYYVENAEDSWKKLWNLFSVSALEYALQTRKTSSYDWYFVNNFGIPERKSSDTDVTAEQKQRTIDSQLKLYTEKTFIAPYDEVYPQYLVDIHNAAGDAEVIVYTPPITWQLMTRFVEMGLLDGYEERLHELIAEFGKVYHFFYPNPIVMDNACFNDAHHPTGATAELIISIIMRLRSGEIQEDAEHGGILLNADNIEELLPRFRGAMQQLVVGRPPTVPIDG